MSSETLKYTPEEWEKEIERLKWLDEHPFSKKWYETCPQLYPGDPGFAKPKYAEKIDIKKAMPKEIKIEKQFDPRDIYVAENNRNPQREAVEERLKKQEERLKTGPWTLIDDQVPVGTQVNGVEVIKPQTKFSEDCIPLENEKVNSTPGERILKEYVKDKKREEIERDMSKCIMSDQEEKAIVEKLHLGEQKQSDEGVVPGDFNGICQDLMALHAKKNKDYGNAADASYREFGLVSYVIRLNDKMNRLKSLTKPGAEQEVKAESIEDTLMDLAAYAIMAIESLRNEKK